MTMPPDTAERDLALEVIDILRRAGHQTLLAGGCVRDLLLGLEPSDFDVATEATPAQVRELFGRRRTLAVGEAFGVIIVLGKRLPDGVVPRVEVATFREDGGYADGRRPDSVSFCSAREDARRRDFTINALFLDPGQTGLAFASDADLRSRIVDHVGGLDDFAARRLRAVGDPAVRFEEDKLRMLRAVRFAQRLGTAFGFTLDPATESAITERADQLTAVSPERILQELTKMLGHPARGDGVRLLQTTGLWPVLFPRLTRGPGELADRLDTLSRHAARLTGAGRDAAGFDSVAVSFAVLFDGLPTDRIDRLGRDLTMSNELRRSILWLPPAAAALQKAERADYYPTLADPRAMSAILFGMTVADDPDLFARRHDELRRGGEFDPRPLLTGGDLIAAGYRPSRRFQPALAAARRGQLNGTITDRADAIAAAAAILETADL